MQRILVEGNLVNAFEHVNLVNNSDITYVTFPAS